MYSHAVPQAPLTGRLLSVCFPVCYLFPSLLFLLILFPCSINYVFNNGSIPISLVFVKTVFCALAPAALLIIFIILPHGQPALSGFAVDHAGGVGIGQSESVAVLVYKIEYFVVIEFIVNVLNDNAVHVENAAQADHGKFRQRQPEESAYDGLDGLSLRTGEVIG